MPTRAWTCRPSSECSSARASVSTDPGEDSGQITANREADSWATMSASRECSLIASRAAPTRRSGQRPAPAFGRGLLELQQQQAERTPVALRARPLLGQQRLERDDVHLAVVGVDPGVVSQAAGGRAPTSATVRGRSAPSAASAAHTAGGIFSIKSSTGATPRGAALDAGCVSTRRSPTPPADSPRALPPPSPPAAAALPAPAPASVPLPAPVRSTGRHRSGRMARRSWCRLKAATADRRMKAVSWSRHRRPMPAGSDSVEVPPGTSTTPWFTFSCGPFGPRPRSRRRSHRRPRRRRHPSGGRRRARGRSRRCPGRTRRRRA